MKNVVCAICNTNKNIKVLYKESVNIKELNEDTFSARRIPDRIHYRFVRCVKCGLIFSNPIISPKKIEKYYKASDFNYSNESDYLRKVYFNYFLNKLGTVDKNSEILEIGCGNGFFLDELNKKGFKKVYGIEPGRKSVTKAPKNIKKNIKIESFSKNFYLNQKFDVVLCFHTLDHIINLDEFLRDINIILKNNGKVFFVVHDTNGLSVKLFGEKSPIFDIEHIYLFNKKSLKSILVKNGFSNVTVFNIVNSYPISYWVKLFPMSLEIKKKFLKLLSKSRLGNIPFSIPAGNIGAVATKKNNSKK